MDTARPPFKRPSILIPEGPPRPAGVPQATPLQTCQSRNAGAGMPWPAISPKELPSPEQAAWCGALPLPHLALWPTGVLLRSCPPIAWPDAPAQTITGGACGSIVKVSF